VSAVGFSAISATYNWMHTVMYPFSYSCSEIPAHAEDLIEAALGAARANKQVHGTFMITGSACELLYR
jgi:hypothetical protein